MIFESDIAPGDMVYIITDPNQHERMCTAVTFGLGGYIKYTLGFGMEDSFHFRGELSKVKDINKLLGIDDKINK